MIVIVPPAPQYLSGVGETVEDFLVEAFVTELAIEALDEAVLLRLARRDVVPGDAGLVLPFQDGARGQLGPIAHWEPTFRGS